MFINRLPSSALGYTLADRNIPPAQIVEKTGISRGHLSKMIHRQPTDIRVETSINLALALNFSYTEFSQDIFGIPPIDTLISSPFQCSPIQLGEMMKTWRCSTGLSLRKLAELVPVMIKAPTTGTEGESYIPMPEWNLSVSHTTIKRIETGGCMQVSIDILFSLALALDLYYWRNIQRCKSQDAAVSTLHLQWMGAAIWGLGCRSKTSDLMQPAPRWQFWTPAEKPAVERTGLKIGDKVIITKLLKITLADQSVVNLPPGTTGFVEEIIDEDSDGDAIYSLGCYPKTTDMRISFIAASSDAGFQENIALDGSVEVQPIPETEWYDADMPGYRRSFDGCYVIHPCGDGPDEIKAEQYLLYQRRYWTPWKFEVHFYIDACEQADKIDGVFCTTSRGGSEVEELTLMVKGTDVVLIEIQVAKNGEVTSFSEIPVQIEVKPRTKLITIWPLVTIEYDGRAHWFESISDDSRFAKLSS